MPETKRWRIRRLVAGTVLSADWSPGAEPATNSERDGRGAAAVTDAAMFVCGT